MGWRQALREAMQSLSVSENDSESPDRPGGPEGTEGPEGTMGLFVLLSPDIWR